MEPMAAPLDVAAPPSAVAVPRRRRSRWSAWVVAAVVAVLVLVPVAAFGYVWRVALADDRTPTDVILVLGAAQFDGRPSPVLSSRLDHARGLFRDDVAPRVVTMGGNQPGDRFTEASAGKRYLVDAGVPASRVVAVGEGSDTVSSMTAVARLMAERGWTSATLVTDPAHEARSLAIARRLGIDARTSPTTSGDGSAITLEYLARETAGLLWFWAVEQWTVPRPVGG